MVCVLSTPQVTFTKQPYNHLRKRFTYLTNSGFDLLNRFLTYDPKKRISAKDALEHSYFKVLLYIISRGKYSSSHLRDMVVGLG